MSEEKNVQRLSIDRTNCYNTTVCDAYMEDDDAGECVSYSDYAALEAEMKVRATETRWWAREVEQHIREALAVLGANATYAPTRIEVAIRKLNALAEDVRKVGEPPEVEK